MKASKSLRGALRPVVAGMLVPALLAAQGCSLFQPHETALTVIPSDDQAEVYVNGQLVGRGTTTVDVKKGKDYAVMAKVGDRAGTALVGRKISGTGVADIIGGIVFLIPFIGVFSPGFWEINPQRISVAVPMAPAWSPTPAPAAYAPAGGFTGRVNPNPSVGSGTYVNPNPAPPARQGGGTSSDGSRLPPRRGN